MSVITGGLNARGVWLPASASPTNSLTWTGDGAGRTLEGTRANDAIWTPGGGASILGGAGDDTYYVGAGDLIFESEWRGTDTVVSNLAYYVLPNNVENLFVSADGAAGAGNSGANIIAGGDGSQTLDGGAGDDILVGGSGADVFVLRRDDIVNNGDVIADFAGGDIIELYGFSAGATLSFFGLVGNNPALQIYQVTDGAYTARFQLGGTSTRLVAGDFAFFGTTPVLAIAGPAAAVAEGNAGTTAISFTVTRSGDKSGASTANWAVLGTGSNPANAADFVGGALPSGTVSFAPGEASRTITVEVAGDTLVEPFEGFTVTLSDPANATLGTAAASGIIRNDDVMPPSLSIAGPSTAVSEGNAGTTTISFTVTRSGNTAGASTANWAVLGSGPNPANGADFGLGVLPSGTVSFSAGETSRTITVSVAGDTLVEPDEGFTVTLSSPAGATLGTATASGTIRNDDVPPPSLSIAGPATPVAEGDAGTTAISFTVTRSGSTAGASTANWAVTGNGASAADFAGGVLPSGMVSFAAGETSRTITVSVAGDTLVEPDEGFTVTLSSPAGATLGTATASGTIRNDDVPPPSLSIAGPATPVAEGNAGTTAISFTVTRSGSTAGASTANWAVTGNGASAADFVGGVLPSGTVSFSAGETSRTITVSVAGDSLVEADEGFTVTLSSPAGATLGTATASGTIRNDDTLVPEADAYTLAEDTTLTVAAAQGVLANDAGGASAALLVAGPSRGSLTLNSNGAFVYTPQANFAGIDSFTYRAALGSQQSNPVTVTLTVTEVNDAPVAGADTVMATAGVAQAITAAALLANDTDPDGDALSITSVGGAFGGTVSLSGSTIIFTPSGTAAGTGGFRYAAIDSQGNRAVGNVTVAITASQITNGSSGADLFDFSDRIIQQIVSAGGGDDTIVGGTVADELDGGAGQDRLDGGPGDDTLTGGVGADIFVVQPGTGGDVITDFQLGQDVLLIDRDYSQFISFADIRAAMTQVGTDTVLRLSATDSVTFRGRRPEWFSPGSFELPAAALENLRPTFSDAFTAFTGTPSGLTATGEATWRTTYMWGSRTLPDNRETQYYVDPTGPANPFALDPAGTLTITAKPTAGLPDGLTYTSGVITSESSAVQTYGYFEVRAKLPAVAGFWPAFWLLPDDGRWPPELDVMEVLGGSPGNLHTSLHTLVNGTRVATTITTVTADLSLDFHAFGVAWRPDRIIWYLDGDPVASMATPADMHRPMYMIANLGVGGVGSWPGPADGTTSGDLVIDHIKAWQFADLAGPWRPPAVQAGLLYGTGGSEQLSGTAGDDWFQPGAGSDTMTGGTGADIFAFTSGQGRNGITDFRPGTDKILVYGGAAVTATPTNWGTMLTIGGTTQVALTGVMSLGPNDIVLGDNPRFGSDADDVLNTAAASRAQNIHAGNGDDTVLGGAGDDLITGGQGQDLLAGGPGRDSFVFRIWDGDDRITDFVSGLDRIMFAGIRASEVWVNPVRELDGTSGLSITYTEGGSIYLPGLTALAAGDIVFVA